MPKIPDEAKKPADRKPKAEKVDPSKPFRFEAHGETYEISGAIDALTPGWLRRHRDDEPLSANLSLLEELCDEDTLTALDTMSLRDNAKVLAAFDDYVTEVVGAELGELSRSSS